MSQAIPLRRSSRLAAKASLASSSNYQTPLSPAAATPIVPSLAVPATAPEPAAGSAKDPVVENRWVQGRAMTFEEEREQDRQVRAIQALLSDINCERMNNATILWLSAKMFNKMASELTLPLQRNPKLRATILDRMKEMSNLPEVIANKCRYEFEAFCRASEYLVRVLEGLKARSSMWVN